LQAVVWTAPTANCNAWNCSLKHEHKPNTHEGRLGANAHRRASAHHHSTNAAVDVPLTACVAPPHVFKHPFPGLDDGEHDTPTICTGRKLGSSVHCCGCRCSNTVGVFVGVAVAAH
jgi:hypothetical protein